MTETLARTLDSLTTGERRTVLLQAAQLHGDIAFERLIRAIAAEVRVLDARDEATLAALSEDMTGGTFG
jgi:hypothetical protein